MMTNTQPAILSDDEVTRVVMETLEYAKEDGLTDPEMERAGELLEQTALKAATFDLWREGAIKVGYDRNRDCLVWYGADDAK